MQRSGASGTSMRGTSGWPLVGLLTLVVLAVQAAVIVFAGVDEEGVRMAIRASARTSVLLFGLAFAASSAYRLWPGPRSRWLLANRRYLGVSFAVSHLVHLIAIVVLIRGFDTPLNVTTLIVGGLGYVFLAAMTATSFDRTAAWLGPRAWARLHGLGARYLWFVFFATLIPSREATWPQLAAFAWLLALASVRTAALLKARRPMATSSVA